MLGKSESRKNNIIDKLMLIIYTLRNSWYAQ